jgi:hypothetical protein
MVAFGQRVNSDDAFASLMAGQRWAVEHWRPTFVDRAERDVPSAGDPACDGGSCLCEGRRVLRLPSATTDHVRWPGTPEPRLMVASTAEMPTLYFVEWHYIDFVLSCVGNVSEAARVLGIRRSTLQRKRKKNPPQR